MVYMFKTKVLKGRLFKEKFTQTRPNIDYVTKILAMTKTTLKNSVPFMEEIWQEFRVKW